MRGQNAGLPAAPPRIPGLPENARFFALSDFAGLNTRIDPPGIADQQFAWCDNLMPIDKRNLRALYDVGDPIYTAPAGLTIINHGWYTLGDGVPHSLVFLSDGSAVSVTLAGAITNVASAGTFVLSPTAPVRFAQYGNQFVCIANNQTNGYFIWDGSNFYKAGTIGPSAVITDGGSGYTSAPTVSVATTGAGIHATFTATVANGAVVQLTCTNPGSGFAVGDLVWPIFSGGGGPTSPQYEAVLSDGVITGTQITNPGTGYTALPTVSVSDPTGSGAVLQASISGGSLAGLTIIAGGSGYSNPTISITGGNGSGAAAVAETSNGVVTGVNMVSAGAGLTGQVSAQMLDPAGSGAEFNIVVHGGAITSLTVLRGGSGYTKTAMVFSGGGLPAASLSIMPFGVNGTDVETYQSRIWISGGSGVGGVHKNSLVFLTAPGSATDFASSDGGGVFPSTDSFLISAYTGIKQAIGFLYLWGDSSINYISGVQVAGTPPITTFSNLNVDPTVGTIWPESIVVYDTTPVFANVYGIHAIIGGTVKKISDAMDGLFYTAPAQPTSYHPSSALHTLFGKHVYLFNYYVTNPVTGQAQFIIMCWDGAKWWTYTPSRQIIDLSTLEYQSNITAYGSDGNSIYPLFVQPSTTITKHLRSKQWPDPSLVIQKSAWGFYALFGAYQSAGQAKFSVSIVTENAVTPLTFDTVAGTPKAAPPTPSVIWAKSAGSQGVGYTIGFDMTSTSEDFVLYEAMLVAQDYALRT